MALLQLFLFILLCSVALGWVARRFQFPYPIALVIGGGVLGFVPRLPELPFNPDLILILVLPPILYQAALLTSWRDFKANIRPIGLLAIGLVIATTLAVGATLKLLVPDIPWAAAFVLGAIVSPPDAVAATAILSRLSIPKRVVTILEGESLVNDASGLVIYKFAVAAVLTGTFSLAGASAQFAWLSLGGIAVGVALSFLFIAIHKRLGDTMIEVLTTLIVPYAAYIAAESMHLSGVLAVVAAGLIRGRYSPAIVSAEMRIIARSVWNMFVFLLNSLVFMLIGLQLSGIVDRLGTSSAQDLALYGLLVCAVAIAVRFLWIHPAAWLSRVLAGRDAKSTSDKATAHIPANELVIMSWCGMRGIVSLAAALALPVALPNGDPFPYRDLIIFLTFVVIAVTLVVQGLTLSPLIRFLKVGQDWSTHDEHQIARAALGTAAATAIDKEAMEAGADADVVARIRAEFADKIAQSTPDPNAPDETSVLEPGAAIARRLRRAGITAERNELLRIWRENLVSDEVLHHIEEELDYQESHI